MNKVYFGSLLGVALVIGIVGLGSAQVILDHPQERKYTQWIAASGTVESIDVDAHKISISTEKGGVREFNLDREVRVIRGESLGNISDVKNGDKVTVRYLRAGLIVTTIKS